MIFTTPIYLLTLLGIPVIVLLHFVRRQRRTQIISSVMLWTEVMREYRRRFLINRLFRNFLLLLQLLLVIVVAIALSNPTIPGSTRRRSENLVVVVDTSASMGAIYIGESRLTRAQRRIADVLGSLSGKSRVLVVSASNNAELVTPGPVSPREAIEVINQLVVSGIAGNIDKALVQILALTSDYDRIVVATDGAFATPDVRVVDTLEFLVISDESENAGITSFSFRTPPNRKSNYELLLRIDSYHRARVNARVTVTVDGSLLYDAVRTLYPGKSDTIVATYDGLTPTTAIARIHLDDALDTDNVAFAVFDPDPETRVLLVSEGNSFLEKAFAIYPNVVLDVIYDDPAVQTYDLIIFDRYEPPPIISGTYIFIATTPSDIGRGGTDLLKNPIVSGWVQNHPVLDGVYPSEISIYQSLEIPRTDPLIESIVHTGENSLIWLYTNGNIEGIGLSFDITGSDLPLRADFPILLANMLSWLDPRIGDVDGAQVQSGDFLTGELKEPGTISVRRPDGTIDRITSSDGSFSYAHTEQVGLYHVESDRSERIFAVNVFSIEETNIRQRAELFSTGIRVDEPYDQDYVSSMGRREIWRLIALGILILLFAEWILWRRGDSV